MGGRPSTILVVESNERMRIILREYLEREGFAAMVVRSIVESLEAVRAGTVTGVIIATGFVTPGGGWIVAERMREISATLPIILLAQQEGDASEVPESISAPHAVVVGTHGLSYLGATIRALLAWDGG